MTMCSVYPIENYNRGMGCNSNFARPKLPTYRGFTVLIKRELVRAKPKISPHAKNQLWASSSFFNQ